ncbi:biotin/lipoyl-binding protein (plasmid) [Janthinobacterium lividum]|nr:biotin/lipoyl-binding protein [Janthinobacterium lividum]
MDIVVPLRRGRRVLLVSAAILAVVVAAMFLWRWVPHGLQVKASELRIATVARGMFLDDLAVRATVEPLKSVMLDSVESGRVEEVFIQDGVVVNKGQLLFRLSNPQRNLELLARQAEYAQQISNLSNLRVSLGTGDSDYQRRLSDLEFNLEQAVKTHLRNVQLKQKGFISDVSLDESADKRAQLQQLVEMEKVNRSAEIKVKHDAIMQMERALAGLRSGLALVQSTVDALAVRAPTAGRLTGFRLQLGETVKVDQHIGRIDDPALFKLTAQVDEFYLNRVTVGRRGSVQNGGQSYVVSVSTVYPQIKEGRFTAELVFVDGQPAGLSPGQSIDAQISLGESVPALLLPNAAFINDSGGAWIYVLAKDGGTAERRPIKTGRRTSKQIEVLSGLAAGDRVIISSYASFGNLPKLQLNQ